MWYHKKLHLLLDYLLTLFFRKFQFMASALDHIAFYHQTKILISFWCRWGLNPRFLIQPSETLSVELTGTHSTKLLEIYPYAQDT